MACNHNWEYKEGSIKERCSICKAARPYNPNRCDHEWVLSGEKERCIKCGNGRPIQIKPKDMVIEHTLIEKPGFFKRLFGRKVND